MNSGARLCRLKNALFRSLVTGHWSLITGHCPETFPSQPTYTFESSIREPHLAHVLSSHPAPPWWAFRLAKVRRGGSSDWITDYLLPSALRLLPSYHFVEFFSESTQRSGSRSTFVGLASSLIEKGALGPSAATVVNTACLPPKVSASGSTMNQSFGGPSCVTVPVSSLHGCLQQPK